MPGLRAYPCAHCGYELRGLLHATKSGVIRCSECGHAVSLEELHARMRDHKLPPGRWWLGVTLPSFLLAAAFLAGPLMFETSAFRFLPIPLIVCAGIIIVRSFAWEWRASHATGLRLLRGFILTLLALAANVVMTFVLALVLIWLVGMFGIFWSWE